MTTNILSPNWAGFTAAPIEPETLRFKPAPAPVYADCEGCVFVGQPSTVCRRASAISVDAGGADCDDPHPTWSSIIYVLDKTDPRQTQLPLLEKGH